MRNMNVHYQMLMLGELSTVTEKNRLPFSCFSLSTRSILTVPWMELGGKCYIKCEKSGYHAVVEFHCKVTAIYPAVR